MNLQSLDLLHFFSRRFHSCQEGERPARGRVVPRGDFAPMRSNNAERTLRPLWVKSRRLHCNRPCPLYSRKRFDVGIIDKLAAHKSGVVMPNEELGGVLEMPVSCTHCPKYSMQPVAFVVTNEKFTCPDCEATIDLTTKEWVAFRQKFRDALKELQP